MASTSSPTARAAVPNCSAAASSGPRPLPDRRGSTLANQGADSGALIDRISVPGKIAEIDEETWWYFLEVLPPKFQRGRLFAFAEGAEALRLFWRNGERHFCRPLTWDETKQFCALARIPLPW